MAEDSKLLQSVASLVPSIYYDLIARVSAGVPFVVCLLWARSNAWKDVLGNFWVLAISLLGTGYILGLVLTTLTAFWSGIIGGVVRLVSGNSIVGWRHASRNDEIAAADKEAGATIFKMQAEATLCQNLLTAYIVLIAANDTGAFSVSLFSGHGPEYRWILFGVLLLAASFRTIVYLERQRGLYEIYVANKARVTAA